MRLAFFMISTMLSMSAWGHCSSDDERQHLKVADVQGSGKEHVVRKEDPDLHKDIWAVASGCATKPP